jgi:hypothetical protein
VSWEPISPELALVDPELAMRARAALSDPAPVARAASPTPATSASAAPKRDHRAYPFWARVTAALWLLVLGVLIGGAAIPHARDKPRVIPANEDPAFCAAPRAPTEPVRPGGVLGRP